MRRNGDQNKTKPNIKGRDARREKNISTAESDFLITLMETTNYLAIDKSKHLRI